ncbi:SLBB domain-containing protein [candidate division KSB1 bacterium]|nr:SLBB domain-containing protein [candidate division KSB1 bacterium]
MKNFITIVILIFITSTLLFSQTNNTTTGSGAAQYILGGRDQVLMAVNIWGFVGKPGQYMVPYGTDLISLLSYAGGPREEAKIKSIKVVRGGDGETKQGEVIEVNVKEYLDKGNNNSIPTLKPGDTVVVSGTTFNFVRNSLEFVVRIAALAQIYAIVEYYLARADD